MWSRFFDSYPFFQFHGNSSLTHKCRHVIGFGAFSSHIMLLRDTHRRSCFWQLLVQPFVPLFSSLGTAKDTVYHMHGSFYPFSIRFSFRKCINSSRRSKERCNDGKLIRLGGTVWLSYGEWRPDICLSFSLWRTPFPSFNTRWEDPVIDSWKTSDPGPNAN